MAMFLFDLQTVASLVLKNARSIAEIHTPTLLPETGGYGEVQSRKA